MIDLAVLIWEAIQGLVVNAAKTLLLAIATQAGISELQKLLGGQTAAVSYLELSSDVVDTTVAVFSTSFGLESIQDQATANTAAIIAAIVSLTDGTTPVSLPPSPPDGYGTSTLGASDVWNYPIFVGDEEPTMGQIMANLEFTRVILGGWVNTEDRGAPLFWLKAPHEAFLDDGYSDLPSPQTTAILSTDTRMSWLAREAPDYDWQQAVGNDEAIFAVSTSSSQFYWWLKMSEGEFDVIKAAMFGGASASGSPLWPGLANVTLGDPVDITTGLTITTPMDGVLVSITAHPAKSAFFTFDDINSYRNLGALAFVSDDGDLELPQGLGFTSAVYSPKSMQHAAGVKLRSVGGVEGTVTPWVIGT